MSRYTFAFSLTLPALVACSGMTPKGHHQPVAAQDPAESSSVKTSEIVSGEEPQSQIPAECQLAVDPVSGNPKGFFKDENLIKPDGMSPPKKDLCEEAPQPPRPDLVCIRYAASNNEMDRYFWGTEREKRCLPLLRKPSQPCPAC